MNLDWYQGSVDADAAETAGEALRAFEMASVYPSVPRNGYNRAAELRRGDTVILKLLWENLGAPSDASCHVIASGRHAAPVATWLRSWQVPHRVSRVDVAEDYSGPRMWDCLSNVSLQVADKHNVKVEHAGDHHRAIEGRTLYLGGRHSAIRACVYEKGLQPEHRGTDPDWVRVELRVRPASRVAKAEASKLSPVELYGGSRWSAELGARLAQPEVTCHSLGTVYRDADEARSRNFLLRQYGAILTKWQGELGGWSELGAEIGRRLTKSDAR